MTMLSGARARFARVAAVAVALVLIGVAVAYAAANSRSPAGAAVAVGRGPAAGTPAAQTPAAQTPAAQTPAAQGLPARADRTPPGSAFVVGDSLTVGTEPWLRVDVRHRGWRLAGVDARVGRPVAEGLQVLRTHRASLPGTVLIALGTNDLGAGRATVTRWLRSARTIAGHRRVIWVNLCLAAGGDARLASYRTINAALDKVAPRFGIQVVDWCAYAHAHDVNPGPDHIHYTPDGYRHRASFYAAAIAGTLPGRLTTAA